MDNIHNNSKRVYHNYKVQDKFIVNSNTNLKYKAPYKDTFEITHCQTNRMVPLQWGATKTRCNICRIELYKSDTNVENIMTENDI